MRHLSTYRVSVKKFNRMCASGVFEDDKVELLNGILTMMTSGPGHDYAVAQLADRILELLPVDRWDVREEKPAQLGLFWKPIPDVAVVRGSRQGFIARTPDAHDIAMIVEVSDTTYSTDTGMKLRRYERCNIAAYWVVDLNRRRVEARHMSEKGLSTPSLFQEDDEIPLVLDGHDYGRISVRDLLP